MTLRSLLSLSERLFQLTHPWGCDSISSGKFGRIFNFNSHTREGVTIRPAYIYPFDVYFNSHTREGVTSLTVPAQLSVPFQLTHPWGCDGTLGASINFSVISTHTPVRVWRILDGQPTDFFIFQLTHPWGCDTIILFTIRKRQISTHTPVRVWRRASKLV